MRRDAKVDRNHAEVAAALRNAGAEVLSLAMLGKGVADLLVSFRGNLKLLEVKDGTKPPSARRLTPDQVAWHQRWPVTVVQSPSEAVEALCVPCSAR